MNAMNPSTEHSLATGEARPTLIQMLAEARAADMREWNDTVPLSGGEARAAILSERSIVLERAIMLTPAETMADAVVQVEILTMYVDNLRDFDHTPETLKERTDDMHAGCWSILRVMERNGATLRHCSRYVDPWLTGPETEAAKGVQS